MRLSSLPLPSEATASRAVIIGVGPWVFLLGAESIAFQSERGDRGGGDSPVQNADERLQRHATKARSRARAPGRCRGQSPNKVVDHLWIGGRGLGIFGGECRGWDEGEPSNARSFAHRHRGRAALQRRLDRPKNPRRTPRELPTRTTRHLALRANARTRV